MNESLSASNGAPRALRNFRQIGGHSPSGQDSTTYAKPKRAAAT